MIKMIINSIKDGTFFKKSFNKIKREIIIIFQKKLYSNMALENRIVFLTFQGDYSCNLKYIAEELIKQGVDCELVWAVRDDKHGEFPKEIKTVNRNTLEFYRLASSSKIIIDNANNFEFLKLKKRKDQILIQTWHGSMGFKKIETNKNKNWMKKSMYLDEITDYCIVNSDFEIDVFKNTFWKTTEKLKYGHPRNDILFNGNKELSLKIKKKYNLDNDTKIVLYAPTFRDNIDLKSYEIDFDRLKSTLEKKFGGEWVVFVKLHFKLKDIKIPKEFYKKVINVTDYPDIQELMCVCDIGITDYSSWMCDYVLTRKPGFLFASDMDEYNVERGFYYPLNETPFALAKNNDELCKNILDFDDKKYQKDVDKFLKDRGCFEEGKASSRTVKKIIELLKK